MPLTDDGFVVSSGSTYFHYNMREYGWPLGCVESHMEWDRKWNNLDGVEFNRVYVVRQIHWWKLAANTAFLIVGAFVLMRLCTYFTDGNTSCRKLR